METATIWRQGDGFWRFRYRDGAEGVDLLSNESYESRERAREAAATAYPGVRLLEEEPPPDGLGLGRTIGVAAAAAGGALVLAVALAVPPLLAVVAIKELRRLAGRS